MPYSKKLHPIEPKNLINYFLCILTGLFFTVLVFGQFETFGLMPVGNAYVHDLLLLLLLAVNLLFSRKLKKSPPAKLLIPISLFIAAGILSLGVNVYRFSVFPLLSSSLYLWRYVLYASLYWIVLQPHIPQKVWRWGLFGVGVGVSILGLVQIIFFPSLRGLMYLGWDEHYGRLFSTFLDPNFVGIFLVLTLLWGVHLFLNRKNKIVLGFLNLAIAIAIVLTYSRSTYLAVGGAIVTWAVLSRNAKIILAMAAFVGIYLLVPKSSLDVNRLDRVISSEARIINWQQSLSQFQEAPILGVGFNTLKIIAGQRKLIDTMGIPSRDAGGVNSSLLFVLITTGVVGGAAYIWILAKTIKVIWLSPYKIMGISAVIALLIHSLFNNSLFYAWIMIWWWMFVGLSERDSTSRR